MAPINQQDPVAQMNTYRSFVSMLVDPAAKDENKLKAAQELSENFETIFASGQYPSFLEHAIRIFLKILQDGDPQFIAEYNVQQLRKLILEILHRIPTNEQLRIHVRSILNVLFKLLEMENEENVLVCLRIVIELHKQYRPQFNPEIQSFLNFVKKIYKELPNHLNKIFEPKPVLKVKDLSEVNINVLLSETYTITNIQTEKKNNDGTIISYNLIPKAVLSLKVLAELPVIVVLMYQLYKQNVQQDVAEFIPLIMNSITLQPAPQHRASPAFNKEIFVDFMAAQIKTMSFVAYTIRIYQEIKNHSSQLVKGMLGLLILCPHEVAHLRKELLVAARHILATDLRNSFIQIIGNLFEENILIGTGWTAHESLRPLAYSTLADFVHHVRQHLSLNDLAIAVHLFSKNVHDETLPTNIQTMSCKLLLNLVDCVRQKSEQDNGNQGRELLMRMLDVFVLKFKTISKLQLPALLAKNRHHPTSVGYSGQSAAVAAGTTPSTTIATQSDVKSDLKDEFGKDKEKPKFGFPASPPQNYSVTECRSLVKTLVCGVKTITWGTAACKVNNESQNKQFQPKETLVFIRLVRFAMQALDIYTINVPGQAPTRGAPLQSVRTKEEKEVLEYFAGVFEMMHPLTFKEVFSTTIDYVVDRIFKNFALQIVANTFLANPNISAIFATILVEYLLERMEEMGSNVERSNLYLKLFKLVFGSVSLFPQENEQMLKPHLHQIVNQSMELAMSAKEPYNYFLLLRALFRSIGGGSHDLLYQEFLPLLPNLLQGLNSLQSGEHKQMMKDLFVELCLTVPVRLSSLLPYLHKLMEPLVSALNGSQTLISQGLRTLELCVDNLQPDFLYDHIQPVGDKLMQALWKTLRNPSDSNSRVTMRVLGKFGGGNRKILGEPQKLEYLEQDNSSPSVTVYFHDHKSPISIPVDKILETSFNALKSSVTEPYYRKQCWEVIKCYLISSIEIEDEHLMQFLSHASFTDDEIPVIQGPFNQCNDPQARKVHEMALTGMFVAAAIKELRSQVLPTMVSLVRQYTMVAISQQCGPFPISNKQPRRQMMDPLVMIDSLAVIMGHEEKELCKPGHLALVLIHDTATTILGSKERACKLPLWEYLVEKMCSLCYDRAWYAKLGGCTAIKFLFERMAQKWVLDHQFVFLRALMFVMMDLTGEVSSGAVDLAKANMDKMLGLCCSPIEPTEENQALIEAQKKSLHDVTNELVRQVTSPNTNVREQAMHALKLLADISKQSVTEIMEPHKDLLADMIPPKKHLLRHQPANAQIGLMDGNTFCTTLSPRLFTIDLNVVEHKVFFTELLNLCEADDASLLKLPCYKSISNLVPLRKSALKALAACHYITPCRDKIFTVLYKSLNSTNNELQEAGFQCMERFISGFQMDMEMVHTTIRPLLLMLGDYRSLSLNVIHRLSYLTQLFPNTFNEKLCEQLLSHLKKWLDVAIHNQKTNFKSNSEIKVCAAIIKIFHQIPAATFKFIEPLVTLTLKTEKLLMIEAGSPLREPLKKFLKVYPSHTIDFFLNPQKLCDEQHARFFEFVLRNESGKIFRDVLEKNSTKLTTAIIGTIQIQNGNNQVEVAKPEMRYAAIRILSLLARQDGQWLSSQHHIVSCIRSLWISAEYQDKYKKFDTSAERMHWQEPKLMVKCMLNFVKNHPNEIELLFQQLRACNGNFMSHFQFLKDFLDQTVASEYAIEWKRKAFFKFVEVFHDKNFPQDLKGNILQYILIPSFSVAFERGEGEKLIGGPPAPDHDAPENIISVFITRVIDPEKPFGTSDAVRILLLQFSCLLVEHASPHIHDAANKRQGNKLRRLMTFAWPCLLSKSCVDPATKYHGHLLLSHIIAKFAIHKRIVLQVFHSLLKAHAVEARTVVRQALDILTPAMPARMEDGNIMLTHWTKKIIVEEGHTIAQLVHMLQLLVRHFKVYYPVRHHLLQHMVGSIQRVGFTPNATLDHKKLAVDLAEVIIKWELQRIKDEQEQSETILDVGEPSTPGSIPVKRTMSADGTTEIKHVRHSSGTSVKAGTSENQKPIEKLHADAVINFLLRIACQVNETTTTAGSPGEILSRRCVSLIKTGLKPEMWPNCDLKLALFDKLLLSVESQSPNIGNICTALDLLGFLLTILSKEAILANFKHLQRGIAACMNCQTAKIIRSVHGLLTKLMNIFPTEPSTSSVASKYEELECLYASVSKVVYEGLSNYEKTANAPSSMLFGTLMILKATCTNNPSYIDRLITSFMRVLQRMAKEHLSTSNSETNAVASELLILSLDLVKNRVGVMAQEMRKAFIGSILVGLIEKTSDVKVLKAITKMVEDWVKTKSSPQNIHQLPTLREKSILLVKMMQYIEKRFPDDNELNAQFLELVNYVYRDEALIASELTSKLEPAFLAGLRCIQPHIRNKFFEVFDSSMKGRLQDRLLYICCSQNWEAMGPHYWIRQCLELILVTADGNHPMQTATPNYLLPSVTAVINMADSQERANFSFISNIKEEPMDIDAVDSNKDEDEIDIELGGSNDENVKDQSTGAIGKKDSTDRKQRLQLLVNRQTKFLESIRKVKTAAFLLASSQLCHMDTQLAHHTWIDLFPRLWKIMSDKQKQILAAEIIPFLCSGSHVIQKDCHPSTINTFMEGLSHCAPSISIKPSILKYLGKSHNLWHRSTLMLEQLAFENGAINQLKTRNTVADCYEFEPTTSPDQETFDAIVQMYSLLGEDDMWCGAWQKKAKYNETAMAIAYEQQGHFEQAQGAYEVAMGKARQDSNSNPASPNLQSEYKLWEDHWIRCSKELNQWDILLEYGNSKGVGNPYLVLESAWRVPNWTLMKEALTQVELHCPKEIAYKVNLYRGFVAICHPDEHHLNMVDRLVEISTNLCIKEWRRLPHIVSHIHLPILQAAQQIMELQEAAQVNKGLLPTNIGCNNSLHDMKAIVKTWRNRLPIISDNLSHWSDIFTWRQHHYQSIVSQYDNHTQHDPQSNHSMLGVHASAQAIIHFGKIARKQMLTGVCLDSLNRIHTIPSVPIVDCFQKIRQQVKCYLQLSSVMGANELQEGLEVIEATNLKYFTKEMTAEFYALKGMFLAQIDRSNDANKAFSAAVQMHDTLVKAWALWGDYLEQTFTKDGPISLGVSTITCYLHACRHQNESKSRKYLAKVLWLLTYDDEKSSLAEAVDKYCVGVPPIQWLPWIPQLLTCLIRQEGKLILNLLSQVGRMFPQAVYFPIRTLYLTLKIEQRERVKSSEASSTKTATLAASNASSNLNTSTTSEPPSPVVSSAESSSDNTAANNPNPSAPQSTPTSTASSSEAGPIRATAAMWRCSRIMHMQRDLHPTILSSLEGIVDQMVWFRENWYEEVLRQLRQGLTKCYAVAFENRGAVSDATITPHTLSFVKKLVSTFGVGIENNNNVSSVSTTFSSAASESLARRAQATAQDPVFQRMKGHFTTDFDFSVPGAMKLHNLINKLKKWIKILEAKTKLLPKTLLIEEKCRFLSNFSLQTAEVELPGEFLLPKHSHYFVRIARFMPRVDIVQKHNTAARRLYIRGHNGKIYPYLVVNDSCMSDSRREERVLQLLRMLNHFLGKQKETSRRLLSFTIPRVVAVSPQMRLVEDNPSSISLLDIYKQRCTKRGIEHDAPIARYYERLATVQARGSQASHSVLRDILKEVQSVTVPKTMLKDWALHTFTAATDYWVFRKQLTLQLALAGFAEFVLHLTRLNPDMIYIHQGSGLMNISYFRFDVDDMSGDLDANRPIPFRLTPNLSEFLSTNGVNGPFTASIIAIARCLVQPNFKAMSLLRAILRDEVISWHKKKQDQTQPPGCQPQDMEGEVIINLVTKAITAINGRLQSLATFEGAESKVSTLVAVANSHDNLCRMDPAWHPWL